MKQRATMSTRPPYLRVVHSAPARASSVPRPLPWPPHWSVPTGAQLNVVGAEPPSVAALEPTIVERPVLRLVRPEPAAPRATSKGRLGVALVTVGSLITFGMAVAAAPLAAVPASAVIAAVVGLTLWA